MKKIWNNFLSTGHENIKIDEILLNQIKFINYCCAVCILFTLAFGVINLLLGFMTSGYFEIATALLLTANIMYLRMSLNYQATSSFILLIMEVVLVFLLFTGGIEGTGIYWFYIFPPLAFFLKGNRRGFFYILFLYMAIIGGYFLYSYGLVSQFYYNFIEIRQLLSSLTALALLIYYYEKTKDANEEKLKKNEKDIVIKNIFDRQFEEAGEIQRTYIPRNIHNSEYMQVEGYYKPAMEIGGDYFDIFPLDEDRTGVIICDVSSKGIPAALIMVKFRTMIKMIFNLETYKPSQLFSYLNKIIAKEIVGHMFITSMYVVINTKTSEIEFANAGHLPLTIYSFLEKEIITINSADLPIGISEGHQYKDRLRKVAPGDILVLYTDGINETINQNREMYGRERLHMQIKNHSQSSAKEISDNIINDIFHFNKGGNQKDDIALVVIKIEQ
jgi:serine phosphatase RsbU (regulator of sigma subunit)